MSTVVSNVAENVTNKTTHHWQVDKKRAWEQVLNCKYENKQLKGLMYHFIDLWYTKCDVRQKKIQIKEF